MKLHNRQYLKPIRKYLRNNSTAAEATLWKILKKSQIGGYKFPPLPRESFRVVLQVKASEWSKKPKRLEAYWAVFKNLRN